MSLNLREELNYWQYKSKVFLWRAWLVMKHRPFAKCPFCKGIAGEMFSERSECSECYEFWHELEDSGIDWAVGRMPLLWWLRSKASIRAGLWHALKFHQLIACRLGLARLDE